MNETLHMIGVDALNVAKLSTVLSAKYE